LALSVCRREDEHQKRRGGEYQGRRRTDEESLGLSEVRTFIDRIESTSRRQEILEQSEDRRFFGETLISEMSE
jgi:hypothetical protein